MLHTGFVAAMAAEYTFSDYDKPATAGTHQAEWIIVSTWGCSSDYLSLARTNMAVASRNKPRSHCDKEKPQREDGFCRSPSALTVMAVCSPGHLHTAVEARLAGTNTPSRARSHGGHNEAGAFAPSDPFPHSLAAPPGLQPTATHLGILIARADDESEAEYLLVRHRPPNVPVGGVFHPSDGFVRVIQRNGSLHLVARGRYAHCHGIFDGQLIVNDVPDPAPGCETARAWRLTAFRCPWIGEFTSARAN